jgi:hypothetical protein
VIDHTVFCLQYSSIVWCVSACHTVPLLQSLSDSLDGEQALNYIERRRDEHKSFRVV